MHMVREAKAGVVQSVWCPAQVPEGVSTRDPRVTMCWHCADCPACQRERLADVAAHAPTHLPWFQRNMRGAQ